MHDLLDHRGPRDIIHVLQKSAKKDAFLLDSLSIPSNTARQTTRASLNRDPAKSCFSLRFPLKYEHKTKQKGVPSKTGRPHVPCGEPPSLCHSLGYLGPPPCLTSLPGPSAAKCEGLSQRGPQLHVAPQPCFGPDTAKARRRGKQRCWVFLEGTLFWAGLKRH